MRSRNSRALPPRRWPCREPWIGTGPAVLASRLVPQHWRNLPTCPLREEGLAHRVGVASRAWNQACNKERGWVGDGLSPPVLPLVLMETLAKRTCGGKKRGGRDRQGKDRPSASRVRRQARGGEGGEVERGDDADSFAPDDPGGDCRNSCGHGEDGGPASPRACRGERGGRHVSARNDDRVAVGSGGRRRKWGGFDALVATDAGRKSRAEAAGRSGRTAGEVGERGSSGLALP